MAQNGSLTPLYLAHLLGLERNLQFAGTKETMEFVDALLTEERLCSLKDLLSSFGFLNPKPGKYQGLIDTWKTAAKAPSGSEEPKETPKETPKVRDFFQESKALYLLTVLPDHVLRERWEEKQVPSALHDKDPSPALLNVMSYSPLHKDLQLCHQLCQEFEASVALESSSLLNDSTQPLEPEGASLTEPPSFLSDDGAITTSPPLTPLSSTFVLSDSPPILTEPAASPLCALPPRPPSDSVPGVKGTLDVDDEVASLPNLEVSIAPEELVSMGDTLAFGDDPTHDCLEGEETVIMDSSRDATRSLSPPGVPTTPIESLPPLARNCIQTIIDNQLDAEFLHDTLRFLRSRAASKSRLSSSAFSPEIKICSWNTLKLAILNRPPYVQDPVFQELSTHDIICLQEVPFASKGTSEDSSVERLRARISHHRTPFKLIASTPSGYGASAKKEVHCILYAEKTWELLGHRTLDASHFDYAPIVAKFRHVDFPDFVFIFTSVHFPPEGRPRDQAKQISAFEEAYKRCVSEGLKEAYTFQGARDARKAKPIHVVMGDFNNVPEFRDLKNAWGEKQTTMKTSAGGRAFDHFYLNKDAFDPFEVEPRVLHLQFDKEKPSDHSPITLRLTKQPESSSKKQTVFKAHHEDEGGEH